MTENKWSVWPWKKTTTISIYGLRNGTLHKRHGNKEEGGRRGQNLPIDSMGKVVSETKKELQPSFMDVPKGLQPSTWLHPAGPEVIHHALIIRNSQTLNNLKSTNLRIHFSFLKQKLAFDQLRNWPLTDAWWRTSGPAGCSQVLGRRPLGLFIKDVSICISQRLITELVKSQFLFHKAKMYSKVCTFQII